MYPLYVTLREGDLFLVDIPVSSLWHGRLGHLSKAGTFGSEGEDIKSVPYAPTVGSLMYAMVATRPDISHAVLQ